MAGYGFYCGLPVILGSLADARGIASELLGWIASSEILGLLLGGLLATWKTDRFGRRRMAIVGVALLGMAQATSLSSAIGLHGLIAARLVGGIGGGCIYAVAVSSLALTTHPSRSVAIFSAVLALVATIEVGALPLLIARGGLTGVFGLLLAVAVIAIPGIGALPEGRSAAGHSTVNASTKIDASAWVMLSGMACFHVAPVVYWTYGERIGVGAGIAETTLGIVFTVSGILGAVACFGADALASRFGQKRSLQIITSALIVGLASWLIGSMTPATYFLRSCLVSIPWVVGGVVQVNLANELDPSGRLSALVGPTQNVGLMIGPAIASTLLSAGQGFPVVLSVATVFLVISMTLSALGQRSSVQRRA